MLTLVAVAHTSLADQMHTVGRASIDEIRGPAAPLQGDHAGRLGASVRRKFVTPRYLRDYLRDFSEVLDG